MISPKKEKKEEQNDERRCFKKRHAEQALVLQHALPPLVPTTTPQEIDFASPVCSCSKPVCAGLIMTLTRYFLTEQASHIPRVPSRIMTAGSPITVDLENILVVDDEEAIREVVCTMLESKGYRCTAVSNGRAAQDQVKRVTPDLVLSDMIMPEMDGIKLLDWLRQYDPEVPVIMVTAIHDISTALEAIRRGAYDYILKPFEKDQLFLGVGRALQHRRLVMENRTYQRNLEQLVEERTAQLTAKHAELEQSYDDTLEALGSALDVKDAETQGHCQRVTAVCISIARAMPVPHPYWAILPRAAFLHDIGKMAIPDGILRKPGPLNDDEKQIMRKHCEIGYNMLIRIPFLRDAAEIVLAHQEFFDGSGYPRGLKGEAIPLGAG